MFFTCLGEHFSVGVNLVVWNMRNTSFGTFYVVLGAELLPMFDGFAFLLLGQCAPDFRPHISRSNGFLGFGESAFNI